MNTDDLIRELLDRGDTTQDSSARMVEPTDEAKMKRVLSLLGKSRSKKSINTPKELVNAYDNFNAKHQFQPGQTVVWKSRMKNRRSPEYGEPAIVVELVEPPILNPGDDSGTSYFREPLDIVIGTLDGDGDLLCFHYDSRRFEPFQAPETF